MTLIADRSLFQPQRKRVQLPRGSTRVVFTWSPAVDGPVSRPSTLVAGVPLPTEPPSESTPPSSAEVSPASTEALPFQLELLHV